MVGEVIGLEKGGGGTGKNHVGDVDAKEEANHFDECPRGGDNGEANEGVGNTGAGGFDFGFVAPSTDPGVSSDDELTKDKDDGENGGGGKEGRDKATQTVDASTGDFEDGDGLETFLPISVT